MKFYSVFKRNDFIVNFLENLFFFHSANSSVVILGFVETIRSVRDSKPVSYPLLHLLQFIDIASRKLGPLLTSFLNLEFVVIARSTVKTWT